MNQEEISKFFYYVKDYAEKNNLSVSDAMTFFHICMTETIALIDSTDADIYIDSICEQMKKDVRRRRKEKNAHGEQPVKP